MYLGSREIDDTLVFTCNTHAADTQVSTDADSAPSYRVYEDEAGTAILTGSMALLDDANTVGQYSEQITLSAANGFELGKSYTIRIQATVGGVTGAVDRHFQVGAKVNVTRIAGTAQTARDIGASVLLSSGTGTGQVNLNSGRVEADTTRWGGTAVASATVRATLEQILGTAVTEGAAGRVAAAFQTFFNVASPVATVASVNQTGDSFARLGLPAGASVSADIAAILAESVTPAEVADEVRVELATELARMDANITSRLASADISLSTGAVTVGTNNDKTGYRLNVTGVDDVKAAVLTTALTESYAADGAEPTLVQAIYAIHQMLQEKSISSTTMTVKGLNGTTTVMTFTLNDATNPTSITRAS